MLRSYASGTVAVSVGAVVQAPGHALNYLRLVFGLLFVASVIRNRVHPAGRMTALLGTSAILAAWAVLLGGAALAPGNWPADLSGGPAMLQTAVIGPRRQSWRVKMRTGNWRVVLAWCALRVG